MLLISTATRRNDLFDFLVTLGDVSILLESAGDFILPLGNILSERMVRRE